MYKFFKDHFQDKKVFITGHTGFKGSWLTAVLLKLGAKIIGFSDKIPTNPSLFDILNLKSNISHIIGDIRDFNNLNTVIKDNNPDIVFHLAAQPIVRRSYKYPMETYQTNVMGTVNLLESIRNLAKSRLNESKTVLNITSDKCYENEEWIYGYREHDKLGGYDPYSSSKACSELVTAAYRNSFFYRNTNINKDNSKFKNNYISSKNIDNLSKIYLSTARAGNVIGGGDWAEDRILADSINALISKKPISLRNPKALRPWQHVLEAIYGYLDLTAAMEDNLEYIGSWNFGPREENIVDVETLVKEIINVWGIGEYKIETNQILHENHLLKLDISKSLYYLNWKPQLDFKKSVKYTVDWYKELYEHSDMFEITNKQIENYFKSI